MQKALGMVGAGQQAELVPPEQAVTIQRDAVIAPIATSVQTPVVMGTSPPG